MAKAARGLDRRNVKDWFAGLSFEVQQTVLDDFASTLEVSKQEKIARLEQELRALRGGQAGSSSGGAKSALKPWAKASPKKGVKIPPKYKDAAGNTWAGRGEQPRWVREYLKKRGTKLDDLLIDKKAR